MAAALFLCSCSPQCLFVHTLKLKMPELPAVWEGMPPVSYSVHWVDEDGEQQAALIAENDEMTITLERGRYQAVFAYPVCFGRKLRPAAALYPFDLEGTGGKLPSNKPDTLKMSYPSGYAAEVIRCIEHAGSNPWAYPVEKLPSAWEGGSCDPWSLSPWKAAQALIIGNFRKSLFPEPNVRVLLPQDRFWWADTPFCCFDPAGSGQTALLHEGISIFLCEGIRLIVCIDKGKATMQRVVSPE